MAIRKEKLKRGTRYVIDVSVNGTRIREKRDTLAEARKREEEILKQIDSAKTQGVKFNKEEHVFGTLRWEHCMKRALIDPEFWGDIKSDTQVRKGEQVVEWMEHYGYQPADVTEEVLLVYINDLKQTGGRLPTGRNSHGSVKPNTAGGINRKLASLSVLLQAGTKIPGGLDSATVVKPLKKRLKENKAKERFLSDEEQVAFLEFIDTLSLHDRGFWLCLYDTGFRISEVLKLTASDVVGDFLINERLKNADFINSIPLTNRLREALEPLVAAAKTRPDKKIFVWSYDEAYIQWKAIKRAMNIAQGDQVTPHTLRHTAAVHMVSGNVNLRIVQEWLGHTNIETTMRYAKYDPRHLAATADVLENSLSQFSDTKPVSNDSERNVRKPPHSFKHH